MIGYRTPNHAEGWFRKRQFRYDVERDVPLSTHQTLLAAFLRLLRLATALTDCSEPQT